MRVFQIVGSGETSPESAQILPSVVVVSKDVGIEDRLPGRIGVEVGRQVEQVARSPLGRRSRRG